MNYWYSSYPNEIFLDLDSNRAIARALSVLRLAIRKRQLPVVEAYLYPTSTKGHAHMIIVLNDNMSWLQRLAWSMWMGNDRLRAAYVLHRHSEFELVHQDLLMSNSRYYRNQDATCKCKKKHKKKSATDRCPAMAHFLGRHRSADYFSRTGSAPPRRKIRVPWGSLNLSQIKHWKEVYERKEGFLQGNGIKRGVREIRTINADSRKTSRNSANVAGPLSAGHSATAFPGGKAPGRNRKKVEGVR